MERLDRNRNKRRSVGRRLLSCMLAFCLFISAFTGIVFFEYTPQVAHAADGDDIWLEYRGNKLSPDKDVYLADASMELDLKSTGTQYEDTSKYTVKWEIHDPIQKNFADLDPLQLSCVVKAKSPGRVHLNVTVVRVEDGGTAAATTLDIIVQFALDTTTTNPDKYKYVYKDDEKRSLVMYSTDNPLQLKLNFGEASNANWTVTNTEIATVDASGKITPIGAGYSTITASYTAQGQTEPYTATLGIYVIPQASKENGGWEKAPTISIESGGYMYTDTVFTNNQEVIRSKIYWSVRQEVAGGTREEIANSAGKTSDIINVSPMSSTSNQMQITGMSGEYFIYLYTFNAAHSSNITDLNVEGDGSYTPTIVKLIIKSSIEENKPVVLGIGDSLNLAKSYNMTEKDFQETFSVANPVTETGAPGTNYATLDANKLNALALREGKVKIVMTIKTGKENHVRELMGLKQDDPLPSSFTTTLTIVDGITLAPMSVVISVGQEYQLNASLHGTYTGGITWKSSNNAYVTVDDTGLIKGVKVTDTSDVTVSASVTIAGGVTRTASTMVKVETAMTDFSLNPDGDKIMNVGDVLTIEALIKETVTVAPLRWISSKEDVFTVTPAADGKTAVINALAGGSGTLMVENLINGNRVQIDITVRIPITDIKFKNDDYKIPFYQSGRNMKDELEIKPDDTNVTGLVWTIDNTSVASLDSTGYLKFKVPGTVSIMVRPEYNPNNLYASCIVKVVGGPDEIIFDNLKDDHLDLEVSEQKVVNVKFVPETAETNLKWTLNVSGLVLLEFDETRRQLTVTGRKTGNGTVTCRTDDNVYYSFTVTVTQGTKSIEFEKDSVTLYRGVENKETADLSKLLKRTPPDSADAVTYKARDEKIAKADEKTGVVTAVAAGKTYVVATTASGRTNSIDVIVIDQVTSITAEKKKLVVNVGETITVTPVIVPATANEKGITWTWEPYDEGGSASISIVEKTTGEVDVTGESPGLVELTGTSKSNKSISVTYLVNVVEKDAKYQTVVMLSPKVKYMNVGRYFKVKKKVTDANNGNKKLKWKSTNTRVATVNSKGRVKSKKVGTTYIVATCQDGSKAKGRMKIVVRNQVTKISLNKTTANLLVGKTTRLRVIYTPRNATVKGVTWKSSDPAIATVNGGKVIAVATGIVKITATSKDSTGKKASCWVTVSEPQPVTNFTITDAQITVAKGKSVNCGITPNPINATDSIRYFSDNPSVASVNSRGKITTHRVGQASIYARASNGVEGRVDVTVVDLNRKAVTLRQYDTEQLMVNQISEGVTWYSADPNIAKVDENGLVTGRLPGTTIIYANVDGVKLGCRVTVTKIR